MALIKTIKDLEKFYEKHKNLFDNPDVEVVLPEVEILEENYYSDPQWWEKILRKLERAIRTAYQSFDRIWPDSHYKLLKHILTLQHLSTIEHEKITFKVITNRGVTHELVRHRIASYTQESTRYVKYWQKHGYKIIYPAWIIEKPEEQVKEWYNFHTKIAQTYWKFLNDRWWKPQEARWILPNDLKTEIIVTMNLRELRHFFTLRCHSAAHPDIRVVALTLLDMLHSKIPLIFDDLYYEFFK